MEPLDYLQIIDGRVILMGLLTWAVIRWAWRS